MRRIRIVFALLAVLLWVPMALLVRSALQSVELEREIRQQTLAERVFDELERQLHDLEEREAARPFADFDFYLRVPAQRQISPLAAAPAEPFILGYFEIDPEGVFSTPRIPRSRATAMARGHWQPTDALERQAERLREIALHGVKIAAAPAAPVVEERIQPPGTTRKAATKRAAGKGDAKTEAVPESADRVDPYQQAFRSLNRAVEPKSKKTRKESGRVRSEAVEVARQRPAPREADLRVAVGAARDAGTFADADISFGARVAAQSPVGFAATLAEGEALLEVEAGDEADGTAEAVPPAGRRLDDAIVEVNPIAGRWVEGGSLVLHRTAIVAGRVYRQGVVVDVRGLTDWLRDEVLGGNPLQGREQLTFAPVTSQPRPIDSDYVYRHRFSSPFDALSATLSIPVLADVRGAGYLYSISALLVVSGTLGLFALYRMVAVAIAFAERRNNFVAAVTHELKTPLTAIRMYGEMLRDGMVPTEEKRHEYYSTITAESERLTRLINNVLEFSRLEQGTREMNLVTGAIGPVVEEAAKLLEPHARDQGFSIRVELDADLPAVRFDRDALLQVVFNLVDNALKYARDASERVITLHCSADGGGVSLAVCDRGPGVAAGHLSKIFEPFYRAEPELTRTAKGTGIGLSLVKGLAERMGAAVSGRNARDGGFEVLLQFRPA